MATTQADFRYSFTDCVYSQILSLNSQTQPTLCTLRAVMHIIPRAMRRVMLVRDAITKSRGKMRSVAALTLAWDCCF
jgi:hypothetical protein